MCTGELGLSRDMKHTLTASTLACTDAQTEVRFVLTGWWSGAPVRGLHPEGESQVLPGCWGAGQSAVLPGAHIWGKGRHSDSTVWKTFSGTQRCMSLAWDVSAQLLDHKASTSVGGACFLCSYIIDCICSHTHAHMDTNIINKCHMKQFAEKDEWLRSPRRALCGNQTSVQFILV